MARTNALYILSVLKAHSDEKHPMTVSQIRKKIVEDFFIGDESSAMDVKNIRNHLNEMCLLLGEDEYCMKEGNIDTFFQFGFFIKRFVRSKDEPDGFIPYDEEDPDLNDPDRSRSPEMYYCYKSIFDDSEVKMLIDSLESYNYLSSGDITGLMLKLSGLTPMGLNSYRKKHYDLNNVDPRIDTHQARLLSNLKILHDIIDAKNFASFINCYYNKDHALQPKNMEPMIVRPQKLVYGNGFYYLLAVVFNERSSHYETWNFRVDRLNAITELKPTNEDRQKYQAEDPGDAASFRLHHPVMYGDKIVDAKMLVWNRPYLLNALHDFFGKEARIREKNEDWLEVTLNCAFTGLRLFATEYCNAVIVLSPEELVDKVKRDIYRAKKAYEDPPI